MQSQSVIHVVNKMPVIYHTTHVDNPPRAPQDNGSFMQRIRSLIGQAASRANMDIHVRMRLVQDQGEERGRYVLHAINDVVIVRLDRGLHGENHFEVCVLRDFVHAVGEMTLIPVDHLRLANFQFRGVTVHVSNQINGLVGGIIFTSNVDGMHFTTAAMFMAAVVRSVLFEYAPHAPPPLPAPPPPPLPPPPPPRPQPLTRPSLADGLASRLAKRQSSC